MEPVTGKLIAGNNEAFEIGGRLRARRISRVTLRNVVVCLALSLITAATWLPRRGPIDLHWDAGAYYLLGTAIAQGGEYRLLNEPGKLPTTLHPPFVPALVAVHQRILGTSELVPVGTALRFTTALFTVAYGVSIFVLLNAYVPWGYAFGAAVIGVLQAQFIYFSDSLYAETFYGVFTMLFFLCYTRSARSRWFVCCAVLAVLAYETRTAGIALLGAWTGDQLFRGPFRRFFTVALISALVVISWAAWIHAVERSPEYRNPAYEYQTAPYVYFNVSYAKNIFSFANPMAPDRGPLTARGLYRRVAGNIKRLPLAVGQALSAWEAPLIVALPLSLLAGAGLVLQFLRKQYVVPVYVALSLAAMCLTPFHPQFVRYLLPLYPLLALAVLLFLRSCFDSLGAHSRGIQRIGMPATAAAIACLIAVQEARSLRDMFGNRYHSASYVQNGKQLEYRLFYYEPVGKAFDEALDWVQLRADRESVVAATDPQWAYLRTGLRAVMPPVEADARKAQQLIDSVPVKYLIAETENAPPRSKPYYRYTAALTAGNPDRWKAVWTSSNGCIRVFERSP